MGLDMYLNKRKYVGYANDTEADITTKDTRWNEKTQSYDKTEVKNHYNKVNYIIQEVGYWRKANQIHKWFVDNCCEGKDDCDEHYLKFEKLLELKELCQKVLNVLNSEHLTSGEKAEVCEELLPTCQGFFFGSYDYDDWYKQDIENTIEIIENVEKEYAPGYDRFYYEASW